MGPPQSACVDSLVVALDDQRATDTAIAGSKGAALTRARLAGLPVLPGFVVSPVAALSFVANEDAAVAAAVRSAWAEASNDGASAVVVRSSSMQEDLADSSMAGRFTSVIDVAGWDAFRDAFESVVASGATAFEADVPSACMAVLVQLFVVPELGGVMFGADPVTGRRDRIVVAAVRGGPHELVAGRVDGLQMTMRSSGRIVEADDEARAAFPLSTRRRLARLSTAVRDHFGESQDTEWAIVEDRLVLLQSRPITALASIGTGPVLGPGPVAETFPDALSVLESELWVEPMREAVTESLRVTGAASVKQLERSPVVVDVGGWVAVDLELLGLEHASGYRSVLSFLDPRGPLRRLRAAWRVGRLRAALPRLAATLIERLDRRLAAVPDPAALTPLELLDVMQRIRRALVAVHGHEMLAGLLLDEHDEPVSAAAVALRVLAEHREEAGDAELIARYPVLLALSPPRVGGTYTLPQMSRQPLTPLSGVHTTQEVREALRLRVRWLQELSARCADALGVALARDHRITAGEIVRDLPLSRLRELASGQVALDLGGEPSPTDPPLPARFRLSDGGEVIALTDRRSGSAGRGAGGGRASGPVVAPDELPRSGGVLVVRTLDPSLASLLPGLAGLVAETGSPLSHLAILARELGVATAVGVEAATELLERGAWVIVDGTTGEVTEFIAEAPNEVAPSESTEDVK